MENHRVESPILSPGTVNVFFDSIELMGYNKVISSLVQYNEDKAIYRNFVAKTG